MKLAISNTIIVILLLDTMEEYRNQTPEEWNFKYLLQQHLDSLLHRQKKLIGRKGNNKMGQVWIC
jgi:hypothetical protein